jgi:transposase InsO family protein
MIGKILHWLHERIKFWTKPATSVLTIGTLLDLTRNRTDLVIENALLRQQLIILERQLKRPQLTNPERFRLVFLAHFTKFWKQALHIVQPETLLRWHQNLFRLYWRQKSQGRPTVESATIVLIQKMANENLLWGAERIRGELLKLGIEVSKRSIQKYMPKDRKAHSSSQTWATFLKNQASHIWACDLTVGNDWLFRQWYIFVVLELKTRRLVHTGVTKYPTDEWTAQPLRDSTPWGKGPKYLIRDRDKKYATHFSAVAGSIQEVKTPYRTPQANGVCERFMGSLGREGIDHILIHDDKHLRRVVTDYAAYFNQERPHQGIEQRMPDQYDQTRSKPTSGRITSKAILGGLHHSYSRPTQLN